MVQYSDWSQALEHLEQLANPTAPYDEDIIDDRCDDRYDDVYCEYHEGYEDFTCEYETFEQKHAAYMAQQDLEWQELMDNDPVFRWIQDML